MNCSFAACGPEALSEWRLGFETLPEGGRQQAIHLVAQWGWYDQAIAVASSQSVFFDYKLLYPRPSITKCMTLPSARSYRPTSCTESFGKRASIAQTRCRAPARAVSCSSHWTRRAVRPGSSVAARRAEDLFDPATNISIGAAHVRELVDRFDGQIPVALAGYNAGPNAASRWLPQQALDPDVWIENIPYNETRGYVQRILWHQLTFAWLRTNASSPQRA